jgi:hypothetical protein
MQMLYSRVQYNFFVLVMLQVQAAAALGLMATDSCNRQAIANAGGVPHLVLLLSSNTEEAQVTVD